MLNSELYSLLTLWDFANLPNRIPYQSSVKRRVLKRGWPQAKRDTLCPLRSSSLNTGRTFRGRCPPLLACALAERVKLSRGKARRPARTIGVPSKSRASRTSAVMNVSPAKQPLTPRLAVPPLPKREGEKSKSQPSPRGDGARRRRAGEGSLSTPLHLDGALLIPSACLLFGLSFCLSRVAARLSILRLTARGQEGVREFSMTRWPDGPIIIKIVIRKRRETGALSFRVSLIRKTD
jgi:hypothetical protein